MRNEHQLWPPVREAGGSGGDGGSGGGSAFQPWSLQQGLSLVLREQARARYWDEISPRRGTACEVLTWHKVLGNSDSND